VPDDRGVGEEPVDVPLAEAREALEVVVHEGVPESLALLEDRRP
jgi:hypothetical protein